MSSEIDTNCKWSDDFLNPIFNRVAKYLQNDDDLIILQEVPYKFNVNNSKFGNICGARTKLEEFCEENNYEILFPVSSPNAYSQTVAICKQGQYVHDETYLKYIISKFPDYRNKIVTVHKNKDPKFRVVGVHIPDQYSGGSVFYDSLINLHRKMPEDIPIFYVGDYNTFNANTFNKRKMYALMAEGLVDFWLEKGNVHNTEIFPEATTFVYVDKKKIKHNERLDYALVTGKDFKELNNKYEMTVDPFVRLNGLSDHSAIILKERTPETKKDR